MGTKTQKLSNVVDQIVEWQSVFTGDGSTGLTAVAGRGYFIDTTSGTVTVTLPASPKIGDTLGIIDYAGTFSTNNVTLDRNGNNIKGSAANETLSTNNGAYTYVYIDDTQGWKNSTSRDDLPQFISATGGTVLTSGDFKTHIFTGDGCFVVSCVGNPGGSDTVEYLVVAGGGGGGFTAAGGGGAGGYRQNYPNPTSTGLPVSASTYPVTVGGGGTGAPGTPGNGASGSNSVFSTITSAGGGGGASGSGPGAGGTATAGGSGGGGAGGTSNSGPAVGGAGNTPPVSPPQGNSGGTSATPAGSPVFGGSGGGGAGASGTSGSTSVAGNGGIGSPLADTFFGPTAPSYGTPGPVGSTRYFSGGGGGSSDSNNPGGNGGSGGGGAGGIFGVRNSSDGSANTGGGGGGSCYSEPPRPGGKGIVAIRYKFQ